MFRPIIHIALHFLVPALVARLGFADKWKYVWLVMVSTMLVDLDHLLADPVFDPGRCSMGFHPLHTWPAVVVYAGMLAVPKLRIIAIGLLIHMLLDTLDCVWMGNFSLTRFTSF